MHKALYSEAGIDGFVHRDIKSDNVFLKTNPLHIQVCETLYTSNSLQIGDFGLTRGKNQVTKCYQDSRQGAGLFIDRLVCAPSSYNDGKFNEETGKKEYCK